MKKLKVLVVEDEMIQSLYLKKTLIALDCEVVSCVTTGKEAIRSAINYQPDLITMDIQLNDEIDGIDATHEIQKVINIPVVYITGNTDYLHTERLQRTRYLELLPKPASRGQISETLETFKSAYSSIERKAVAVS